jgi:hypothetical protein
VNALGGVVQQAGKDVGEPSLRIDVVELGTGNERIDRRFSGKKCSAIKAPWI